MDILSEKNNDFNELIKIKEKPSELEKLKKKIKYFKKENNKIKKKLIFQYENEIIKRINFIKDSDDNFNCVKTKAKSMSQNIRKK